MYPTGPKKKDEICNRIKIHGLYLHVNPLAGVLFWKLKYQPAVWSGVRRYAATMSPDEPFRSMDGGAALIGAHDHRNADESCGAIKTQGSGLKTQAKRF